jgi:hypothetical protein
MNEPDHRVEHDVAVPGPAHDGRVDRAVTTTSPETEPSLASSIAEAEALQAALAEAWARAGRLTIALRRDRVRERPADATLPSSQAPEPPEVTASQAHPGLLWVHSIHPPSGQEVVSIARLNVGVSRKVGLPDYGSAGASCNIEIELSSELLRRDRDGFQEQVRAAYAAARRAVYDELSRLLPQAAPARCEVPARVCLRTPQHGSRDAPNGSCGWAATRPATPRTSATVNQLRAIAAIARRRGVDLEGLLRAEYGVDRPEDLSASAASRLIGQLESPTTAV